MLNNTEIIGIDHGNRNMKTASSVFSAAIQPLQTRPNILCWRTGPGNGACR